MIPQDPENPNKLKEPFWKNQFGIFEKFLYIWKCVRSNNEFLQIENKNKQK